VPLSVPHRHYFTIEQRETLQAILAARAAVLREEVGADARENLNAEPELAALQRDVEELRAIEETLARLHEPEFGLCIECGADIPYVRLRASPTALRCLACQTQHEQAAGPAP
jgi:DnaK suppressor protein